MTVRIVRQEELAHDCTDSDYVRVCTCSDPNDDTVTLATIQRVIDKTNGTLESRRNWHIRTLVLEKPMSLHEALGLAACYAERKRIPVVYSDQD